MDLLDAGSRPRLRIALLDLLALAAEELGRREARDAWLEAQHWSESAGEDPLPCCRRWAQLAELQPAEHMDDTEAAYRAAIRGYRALGFRADANRLQDLRRRDER